MTLLPPIAESDHPNSVRYWGRYPNEVFALVNIGYDENQTNRAFRYLGRDASKRFAAADCPEGCSVLPAFGMYAFLPPEPECQAGCEPFDIYAAEQQAAWDQKMGPNLAVPPPSALLFGQGGPMLVIGRQQLAVWNGASWELRAAPWCSVGSHGALRLSNGASFVLSEDCVGERKSIFWISPSGKPHRIELQTPSMQHQLGEIRFRAPVELERQIWLLADTDAGTALLAPVTPSEVSRPFTQGGS